VIARPGGGLGALLDFLSDWAVAALAVWTLIAYGGMATEAPVDVLTPIWLVTLPLIALALIWLRGGKERAEPPRPDATGVSRRSWWAPAVGVAAALAAAATAVAGAPWPLVWALALCAVAAAFFGVRRRLSPVPAAEQPSSAHVFAAVSGLVVAGMSLFLERPSTDDVFYVGRATATAELNHIPVRDVIFTQEQVDRSGGTGLPTDSFSALQGAVGQLFHVHPASVAYYLVPPLMSFLAVWALWRLLRLWAPRHVAFCFALGLVFWLWSAQNIDQGGFPYVGSLTRGNYFITRIWQGKVVLVCWLVPTLYAYMTGWLPGRDRRNAVLILCAAVAGIGLSSSAAFVLPLVFLAGAVGFALLRAWVPLALLAVAAAIPFAIGFSAAKEFPLPAFATNQPPTDWYYTAVFGAGVIAFTGTVAVLLGPWLVRRGPAAAITAGVAGVTVLLLAPGLFAAVDNIFGLYAPGALRRTLWLAPLPVSVGLLAAAPWGELAALSGKRLTRLEGWSRGWPAAGLLAGSIAVLLIVFGHPLWLASDNASYWHSRPRWKVDQKALVAAHAILSRYQGSGSILTDKPIMALLPIIGAEPKAVNSRTLYVQRTSEPAARTEERLLLTQFVTNQRPLPESDAMRRAAADLDVGLVCLSRGHAQQRARLEAVGVFRPTFEVAGYKCYSRR
jgi:hypothetical protein